MAPSKAFVLCAGLGTRFQPQTNFYPKPVLPFFNIPQALYSTSALKEFGVNDFYYNSHHLPQALEEGLKPFFRNKPFYEELLLDSAGGVSNIKESFKNDENFWVINGDSFIHYEDTDFLKEALSLHQSNNALATLIGISEKKEGLNGLMLDSQNRFTGLSRDSESLHFIGLYILSSEILPHFELRPMKLFGDILMKSEVKDRVYVYNAPNSIKWFETGNEKDFINCSLTEAQDLLDKKDDSFIYRTHLNWGLTDNLEEKLQRFMKDRHWGLNSYISKDPGSFVCLPENTEIDANATLKNTVVQSNLVIKSSLSFEDRVLVDSSQWT